jgi:uncharacterized membrane protein
MKENLKLELLGSAQLIVGMVLALLWSFYSSEWWSAVLGYLAVFFLIEAIWHFILCDYKRHLQKSNIA